MATIHIQAKILHTCMGLRMFDNSKYKKKISIGS
jgi:hypothetical protein